MAYDISVFIDFDGVEVISEPDWRYYLKPDMRDTQRPAEMFLVSNIRLVLLIFVPFLLVLLFRRRYNLICLGLHCICKFSTHKITLLSKSQRWVYSLVALMFL